MRIGLEAFAHGDYARATQSWERAWQNGTQSGLATALAEACFRRALSAASEARQIQDLSEAVQLAPDRALYHFHLGLAYFRHGQLRRAIEALGAACRIDPDNARFDHHLALATLADPLATRGSLSFLQGTRSGGDATLRVHALAKLRQGEPTSAVAALATQTKRSALASLGVALAQLAAARPREALGQLQDLSRSAALSDEGRQAAAIGTLAAYLQLGDARAAFDELCQLSPPAEPRLRATFVAVTTRLVQELVLDERIEEAVLACQKALAAGSDSATPMRQLLGHLHEVLATRGTQHGDFAVAARHWEAALATDSANPRILRNLALAEEKLERWESACRRWEALAQRWKKELRVVPDNRNRAEMRLRLATIYRHLAITFEAAGDVHGAVRSLETALNFDASQVDLQLRVAELSLDAEDYGKAIDNLRRALSANPDDTRVLATLGTACNLKGEDRQGEAYLNQALALEPENQAAKAGLAGVHHERGHRLLRGGQAERAAQEFWKAMDLDRSIDEHALCLGEAYLELGWLKAAGKAFDVSLTTSLDPIATRLRIGGAYLAGGFEQEADRTFRQALRISRAPFIRVAIGHAYMLHRRSEAANQQFQHVRKSRDSQANAAIGRLFIKAGRENEAIPYLERAVSLDGLDASTYLDLA